MTRTRRFGIIVLIIYTLVITVLRAFRTPNNFSEAHWLLDYRFGFVKRGLIGEIVSLVTGTLGIPITEQLVATLASAAFVIFCVALTLLSIRIVQRSGWSTEAVLASLVFLSSSFIVMSAHLNGYYDNIVIVLGIFSIVLLLKGRPWLGACLQIPALLTHENTIFLVFPPFCLAWLLINSRNQKLGTRILPFLPLLLPMCAFLVMGVYQELFLAHNFVEQFTAYLSQFPYIQNDANNTVPVWIARPLLEYYVAQSVSFPERIALLVMYGVVLPATLAILFVVVSVYQIRDLSVESFALLAVCFVPQIMHIVAWDTARIWTYTILCTFLTLWLYSEIFTAHEGSAASRLLSLAALIVNVLAMTPLMDGEFDHYSLTTRLLLYAPVILGSLALILFAKNIPFAERLSIQGIPVSKLLYSPNGSRASTSTSRSEPEVTYRADVTHQ